MAQQTFVNYGPITLAAACLISDTQITVTNPSALPLTGNISLVIDNEIMLGTSRAGAIVQVNRAQEGTSAAGHLLGAAVLPEITAGGLLQMKADIEGAVSGTGFLHVTGGVWDSAAAAVNLATEVTGILPTSSGGTGLSAIGGANSVLTSTGTALAFAAVLAASVLPSISLTGDVNGSGAGGNIATTVEALQGFPVANTAPTTTYVLTWNGSAWAPAASGSGGISQLTGDVLAGPGSGSQAATVVALDGQPISYGAFHIGQVLYWNGSDWTNSTQTLAQLSAPTGTGIAYVSSAAWSAAAVTLSQDVTQGALSGSNVPLTVTQMQNGAAKVDSLGSITGYLHVSSLNTGYALGQGGPSGNDTVLTFGYANISGGPPYNNYSIMGDGTSTFLAPSGGAGNTIWFGASGSPAFSMFVNTGGQPGSFQLGGTQEFGGGVGVMGMLAATTIPSSAPGLSGAVILWSHSDATIGGASSLFFMNDAGTTFDLALVGKAITSLTGDVTGTGPGATATTVGRVNGTTYPAGGALTTGNGPYVSGASAVTYSALNLAGGSGWVTGLLPAANQAAQTLSGDVTGTTAADTVVQITGSSSVCDVVSGTALSFLTTGSSVSTAGRINFVGDTTEVSMAFHFNTHDYGLISHDGSGDVYIGTHGATANTGAVYVYFVGANNNYLAFNPNATINATSLLVQSTPAFFDSASNVTVGGTTADFGGGAGLVSMAPVTTAPTSNPTSNYLLYNSGGALVGRGTSGTITTIGPADLFEHTEDKHCPRCHGDFGHSWSNPKLGKLTVCMWCLAEELGERDYIVREAA